MELGFFSSSALTFTFSLFFFFFFCNAQQTYINNKQLDCYNYKNDSFTNGYSCNGPDTSCTSYLTFRSHPPNYDSANSIGYLLGSEPSMIAKINNITDVDKIPLDKLVIVPVSCSCSTSSNLYQHNTRYILKYSSETYFSVANDTYQGLTTCQALMTRNPDYESRNLSVGLNLVVPLRCACPSRNQTAAGVKYLLSYLITWGDSISSIAETFSGGGGGGGGGGVDPQSVYDANELEPDSTIFPFTTVLVPLKSEPKMIQATSLIPPPTDQSSLPPTPPIEPKTNNTSSKKWVWIGIGIGSGLLLLVLSGFLVWFLGHRRSKQSKEPFPEVKRVVVVGDSSADEYNSKQTSHGNRDSYWSVSSEGVRYAMDSLILYRFEELQTATGFFREENRIKGSVYRGVMNGDNAAIKRMKGDVSNEINILKQINHSNVIRLSGFCIHEGNTFLVYEFVENGSLSDWLHHNHDENKKYHSLGWKQRVQIAYQVADGLNYLHNDANPPYIHKDLKSSNILLDGNMRAKIANFGVARSIVMENNQEEEVDSGGGGGEQMQLTMHVVGTQGYMAPEYLENGVITPKLDVFAFGVVILELLSGREAATPSESDNEKTERDVLLSESIKMVLEGENVREKLINFIDPSLKQDYPLDLVFSMAQLAMDCVAPDLTSRPTMLNVFMSLSKILSSSLDWDPSV
ncbi:Protein kinase domain [Macleaya cordata]|uniref:Protein kinase domain n=1 Tax=Macleaya cordata TaxID=56857 RepID=A0A200PPQ5_MACCD|nr:Protein kinase domain [Macleaya cordata]